MNGSRTKVILSVVAIAAFAIIVCLAADVFSVTHAIASPATVWKGGAPRTLSSDDLMRVGSTTLTESDAFEWQLPGDDIYLLAAVTPAEQEQGLGDIASLASTTGMFFVFGRSDDYGFWMKGMEFPLDIIWLDQDFTVIHIESDLLPSTYPTIFYPGGSARYVIEVNAGTAAEFSIHPGETLQIYQK